MRIAFDTGGTFTDCVFLRGGRLEILKVPSTPRKPSEAIAHALDQIRDPAPIMAELSNSSAALRLAQTPFFSEKAGASRSSRPRASKTFSKLAGKRARNFTICCSRSRSRSFRESAAPWAARKAGFRWPCPACAVYSRDRAESCAQSSRSGADSIAVCLLFSFVNPCPRKIVGTSPRYHGTTRFRLARNPSRISRIRADLHDRRQCVSRSGDERLSFGNRAYRRSAFAEACPLVRIIRRTGERFKSSHHAVERRHSLRHVGRKRTSSNDSVRPRGRRTRRAICRRSCRIRTHHHV